MKFLIRVRKPETGFFSSFQSENELEGSISHSSASIEAFLKQAKPVICTVHLYCERELKESWDVREHLEDLS